MKTPIRTFLLVMLTAAFLCGCQREKEEPVFHKPQEDDKITETEIKTDSENVIAETEKTGEDVPVENKVKKDSNGDYKRIKAADAESYIGKRVLVEGYVADVVVREKVAYLNFEKRYPDNPFTGVVFASDFEEFGDLKKYKGKTVILKGKVSEYKGKPQIILNSPSQIQQ